MLVNDGGGNSDPYQIKTNPVAGGGEESSMNYQQIMQILHGLKGHEVAGAADSFRQLGTALDTVASKLAAEGDKLGGENWSGAAASAAMAKFQQLHDQAAQLAAQAHSTANVMDWVGNDVLPKFASIPSPQVMGSGGQAAAGAAAGTAVMPGVGTALGAGAAAIFGGDGQAKADQAARQYLAALNNHLATANNSLPASTAGPVSHNSNVGNAGWTTPSQGGSNSGGGPGSGYGGVGGSNGPGSGAVSPYAPPAGGHASLANLPQGNGGSVTAPRSGGPVPSPHGAGASLQSIAPSPAAPATSPFTPGAPVGTGSASPFSSMPVLPGGTGFGAGGMAGGAAAGENALKLGKNGLPGEGSALGDGAVAADGALGAEGSTVTAGDAGAASAVGAEGAAGAAASDAAGAAGAEAAGAAGGEGAGMMPMGMGGGGSQDSERQRQAWMNEDESIWGVPDENTGPVLE